MCQAQHPISRDRRDIPPHLPGADLVAKGIEALRRGQRTQEAFLVAVAATRLAALGVRIPQVAFAIKTPNLTLYDAVCEAGGGHSQYNALLRRLTSFIHAYASFSRESSIDKKGRRTNAFGCDHRG